jgi:hypothetical protein
MKEILVAKGNKSLTVFIPERSDIENLQVGDLAPNCFGGTGRVDRIFARMEDNNGKLFVCYYVEWGKKGSTISESMKEGELIRSLHACSLFTSAELDEIERRYR